MLKDDELAVIELCVSLLDECQVCRYQKHMTALKPEAEGDKSKFSDLSSFLRRETSGNQSEVSLHMMPLFNLVPPAQQHFFTPSLPKTIPPFSKTYILTTKKKHRLTSVLLFICALLYLLSRANKKEIGIWETTLITGQFVPQEGAARSSPYSGNVEFLIFLIDDHGHAVIFIKGDGHIIVWIDDIAQQIGWSDGF